MKIRKLKGLSQHHFVECSHKVAIEELSFIQSLPNNSSNKFEKLNHFLFLVNFWFWIWIISASIRTLLKQRVVRIKNTLTNKLEPFFRETSLVNSLLVMELDWEFLLPALYHNIFQLLETVTKYLISPYLDIYFIELIIVSILLFKMLFDQVSPQQPFRRKVQKLR